MYEHVEGHRNDSAAIIDLALTTHRFDAGLLRNITTELYNVLIMLTRRRAQRLVLKAAEPEGLEAYRLLLRRYEPIFNGHDSFETCGYAGNHVRVTSWEHEARNIVRFDQNRSCHQRSGERWFSGSEDRTVAGNMASNRAKGSSPETHTGVKINSWSTASRTEELKNQIGNYVRHTVTNIHHDAVRASRADLVRYA